MCIMAENLHLEIEGRKTLSFKGPRVLRQKCQRNCLPRAAIDTATLLNPRDIYITWL